MDTFVAASLAFESRHGRQGPGTGWRFWLLLLACACHGLAWAAAPAASAESATKAAFLYRFAGLVEWPPGSFARAEDPLVIAIAGDDTVASELELTAAGRTVNGRPVFVRRLPAADAPAGLHVLFVSASAQWRMREFAAVAGPLLLVTEHEDGHRLGAVLNFVVDGERVRFTASLPAADARGLRLSAGLLAVAQSVEGRTR
jgi:hypothetical protein